MEGDNIAEDDSSASSGMEDIDRRKALQKKIAKLNSELFFLEKKMEKEGCYGQTSTKTKKQSTAEDFLCHDSDDEGKSGDCSRQTRSTRKVALYSKAEDLLDSGVSTLIFIFAKNKTSTDKAYVKPIGKYAKRKLRSHEGQKFLKVFGGDVDVIEDPVEGRSLKQRRARRRKETHDEDGSSDPGETEVPDSSQEPDEEDSKDDGDIFAVEAPEGTNDLAVTERPFPEQRRNKRKKRKNDAESIAQTIAPAKRTCSNPRRSRRNLRTKDAELPEPIAQTEAPEVSIQNETRNIVTRPCRVMLTRLADQELSEYLPEHAQSISPPTPPIDLDNSGPEGECIVVGSPPTPPVEMWVSMETVPNVIEGNSGPEEESTIIGSPQQTSDAYSCDTAVIKSPLRDPYLDNPGQFNNQSLLFNPEVYF